MKILAWILVGLVAIVMAIGIVQTIAAERVEVIELHTTDDQGERIKTRLWIVDYERYQYLRVGGHGSGWYSRIQANEQISVTRGKNTGTYTVVTRPDISEKINELMQAKYTWGDSFFAVVFAAAA